MYFSDNFLGEPSSICLHCHKSYIINIYPIIANPCYATDSDTVTVKTVTESVTGERSEPVWPSGKALGW